MHTATRNVLIILALLFTLGLLLISQRHSILVRLLTVEGPIELAPPTQEGPNVRWHDDYFTVEALAEGVFAIGEPRYYQQNFSYLIMGEDRAVLFDAGPGHRDIRPVADSLTDLPITFIPSHFHYDHTGNTVTFEDVAVVDLPYLRARERGGKLQLSTEEHLGEIEGFATPTLEVDDWLALGSEIDLGGRTLTVLYTPGHTEESISLLESPSGFLFSGDFIYPGPLFAFLQNSGMGDYLQGAENVLSAVTPQTRIFAAHRVEAPGAPELGARDVRDLEATLHAIRNGETEATGLYPWVYVVNDRIELHAEPSWLQNWERRHPELSP
ncbi:MAG: MBL fold metallo-hydrolase [Myxococcota bacterium]|nr:MBL fold metallo-hydrolase [Myxococcota bacterium]